MKLLPFALAALLALATTATAQGISQPRPLTLPDDIEIAALKDTGNLAIAELMAKFAADEGASTAKSYIILPLGKDIEQGYFTLQFENAFTQKARAAGYKLYTRTDKTLEKVLTEIGFQQNYADSLDQGTVQKLALVGAEAVVVPLIIPDPRSQDGSITLRANMSVYSATTGEKMWGLEVSKVIHGQVTTEQWITRGIIALAAFAVLMIAIWLIRTLRRAARPR